VDVATGITTYVNDTDNQEKFNYVITKGLDNTNILLESKEGHNIALEYYNNPLLPINTIIKIYDMTAINYDYKNR